MIVPLILDNSPNTAMILGAALSGCKSISRKGKEARR